jgi:hypothetical protein
LEMVKGHKQESCERDLQVGSSAQEVWMCKPPAHWIKCPRSVDVQAACNLDKVPKKCGCAAAYRRAVRDRCS